MSKVWLLDHGESSELPGRWKHFRVITKEGKKGRKGEEGKTPERRPTVESWWV